MYAQQFKLESVIKFKHEVVTIERADDYDKTGRWQVTVRDADNNQATVTYDAVIVASGHHVHPSVPVFDGQKEFNGKIMHSHSYKTAAELIGKKVVVSKRSGGSTIIN